MNNTYDEATRKVKIKDLQEVESLDALQRELSAGLSMYWSFAGQILSGSGIKLLDPAEDFFSIEKNFFSALFCIPTTVPQYLNPVEFFMSL
jgi:hypothetical protein